MPRYRRRSGSPSRVPAFRTILEQVGVTARQVCYVGDDLPDLQVLKVCGLAVAVADACPEVVAQAHYVTHRAGGKGAVREVVELILKAQGVWREAIERFAHASAAPGLRNGHGRAAAHVR